MNKRTHTHRNTETSAPQLLAAYLAGEDGETYFIFDRPVLINTALLDTGTVSGQSMTGGDYLSRGHYIAVAYEDGPFTIGDPYDLPAGSVTSLAGVPCAHHVGKLGPPDTDPA
jgi:hypothetical protein